MRGVQFDGPWRRLDYLDPSSRATVLVASAADIQGTCGGDAVRCLISPILQHEFHYFHVFVGSEDCVELLF